MSSVNLNNKKSRKFLALVKNTVNDLEQYAGNDQDIIEMLNNIIETKKLTLLNVQGLYLVFQARKNHIDYIKVIQDEYSFNLINEEHRYMEDFLSKYFIFDSNDEELLTIGLFSRES